MIRHAAAAAFPVGSLVVAVIEPPLLAFLVLLVGGTPLFPPFFFPASLAAIPVAPVTVTTDPEHRATANTPANPAAQELLAGPHPRPIGGRGPPRLVMAIPIPFTDNVGPALPRRRKKTRLPANGRGFLFPRAAPPCQVLGKPPRRRRVNLPLSEITQKSTALKLVLPCPLFPSAELNAALFSV